MQKGNLRGNHRFRKLIYTIIFIMWVLPSVCWAQDIPPFSGRVQVVVDANENIKAEIESYISRELRSLGDIIVTDDEPRWILDILAIESKKTGDYTTGIVLSIVILEPYNNKFLIEQVNPKYKADALLETMGLSEYTAHSVRTGPTDSLRNICNEVVADFDSKHLKQAREMRQKVINILQKRNKDNKP